MDFAGLLVGLGGVGVFLWVTLCVWFSVCGGFGLAFVCVVFVGK